jgi:hypothetical protein
MRALGIVIILGLLVLLSGCKVKEPLKVTQTANVDYKVAFLFEHEGCRVYRFTDSYTGRYFTNCSGSTTWREGCGKNCSREAGVSGGGQ